MPSTWERDGRFVIEALERIEENVGAIKHDLNGNGKPGLKAEVAKLMEERGVRRWVWGTVLTVVITTGLGLLWTNFRLAMAMEQQQTSQPAKP